MCAVADKEHAVVHEAIQLGAAEFVDAHPVEAEGHVADNGFDPGDHLFFRRFGFGIGFGTQLQIDAVDVVGLFVQQRGLARVEGRGKPEPAFGVLGLERAVGQFDVDNQEMLFEGLAFEGQVHALASGRAGAFGGDVEFRFDLVDAVGGLNAQAHVVAMVCMIRDLVEKAQVDEVAQLLRPFHEVLFNVVLLEVYEGRVLVAVLGQQIKAVDFVSAVEQSAHLPGHTLVAHAFAHAKAVKDFERTFGPANGAGPDRDHVVVVQHNGFDTVLRQVDGHGEADGACPDDGHGMAWFGGCQTGRCCVRKWGVIIGHRGGPF